MRRVGAAAALALAALATVVLVRTLAVGSRRGPPAPAAPPAAHVEGSALAQRLAAGLRLRTVSHEEEGRVEADAFRAFRQLLAADYPRAHRALTREIVAGHSLLYTWPGRDPASPGVLLAAHQDVVPAPDAADWTHPPFAGEVAGGAVWGRGAMDDKGSLFCLLEAVEGLVAEGFEPQRSVYLAFGHDEEVGGEAGARAIAELLARRGVRLELVLDEGGLVADGMLALVPRPLALVGVAEKGSLSVRLRVEAAGGHSSVPPRHSAVGILAAAVRTLEEHSMPARLTPPTRRFLEQLAPALPFAARAVVANLWLAWPLVAAGSARVPPLDAMLRTTTAATVFHAGVKANVLPREAEAIVNFRILPGDRVEDVLAHVRETIDDERVQVEATRVPREASPVSPTHSEAFASLRRVISASFPDALVAPYLVLGGTDARHYAGLTDDVYRFGPFRYGADALELAHGRDERISIDNLVRGVLFYRALLRELASQSPSPME